MHYKDAAPPSKSAVFAVDAMSYAYSGRPVFDGFSLDVCPGEFLAVLGPSGCGKTTLLNLLSGFLAPTAGTIQLDGTAVRPEAAALGYVFQSSNLFPWLTALENVRFGLKMRGTLSEAAQREKARAYLDLVGLSDSADILPHRLSGGMRQRVALARSLVLEPRLLLMDEPFAALDAITRIEMNEELLRLWSRLGQTILFITHDIDEAVFLADRVIVLGLPPTGIVHELRVDLPRPRDRHQMRTSPLFADYTDRLMSGIEAVMAASPFTSYRSDQR